MKFTKENTTGFILYFYVDGKAHFSHLYVRVSYVFFNLCPKKRILILEKLEMQEKRREERVRNVAEDHERLQRANICINGIPINVEIRNMKQVLYK